MLWVLELCAAIIAWLFYATIFSVRARSSHSAPLRKDRRSQVGIFLQVLGFTVVWLGMRRPGSAFLPFDGIFELVVACTAIVVLAASLLVMNTSVTTLGKQWSLTARVANGHNLITYGIYGFVRHPIYLGMFGLLVGTALAVSTWKILLVEVPVFLAGTLVRIRVEERLLTEQFGDEYRRYAQIVPMLIPWL